MSQGVWAASGSCERELKGNDHCSHRNSSAGLKQLGCWQRMGNQLRADWNQGWGVVGVAFDDMKELERL